ncbi:hypothetical protein PVAND_008961 [Polypedilum vanderplanki]|uniref:Akirin n=1 Tax=Polypedilum vanderplanki TaxID=319348 RepID=A0A9J6CB76_POLVA|nr:hypothetical protein PVAND_008961 [Polypedilum vanderplanki]
MACATLKRSLDWEALNQRPAKRRRCLPFGTGPSSPTSPSTSAASKIIENSPFAEVAACTPRLTPEKMAENIREEIRRLHRRKQLSFNQSNMDQMQDSESSGSEMGAESPRRPDTPPTAVKNPEMALFTFKQVQMICERMLKEREEKLREQYDAVLNNKLAEQYDAFVKFTYDQIQRRYEAAPSYLS